MQHPHYENSFCETGVPLELQSLYRFGIKLGLQNISSLLKSFYNPHHNMNFIHIAGTNGKGSTSAMINSIFIKHGFKTGLYTSPHLVDFRERFQINGKKIHPGELKKWVRLIMQILKKESIPGTFFEVITAIAINYFHYHNTDISVMEVGMGGRFDATNVIKPEVGIISQIDFDHQKYLGRTLKQISFEKAGIIKQDMDTVIGVKRTHLRDYFLNICHKRKSSPYLIDKDFYYVTNPNGTFDFCNNEISIKNIKISLRGKHQIRNASCAIQASFLYMKRKGLKINHEFIRDAIREVKWPGRFQILSSNPYIILDGAHNMSGIRSLRETLETYYPDKDIVFLLGFLKDKPFINMIKHLSDIGKTFMVAPLNHKRTVYPDKAGMIFSRVVPDIIFLPSVANGIEYYVNNLNSSSSILCITGSLFAVSEALLGKVCH